MADEHLAKRVGDVKQALGFGDLVGAQEVARRQRYRAQNRVALSLLHPGVAGHAVDYDLVDDSFGAFFGDIENQAHLFVCSFVRQLVRKGLNLGFDKSFARVQVEQPIRVGAFLRGRIRRAHNCIDFFSQALFGKNLGAAKLDAGHPRQRSFHDLKSDHHGVLVH